MGFEGDDAELGVQALQFLLLAVRVELDLVHGGNYRCFRQESVKDLRHEVADTNRAYLAVGEELLKRPVRVDREVEPARQRLVQQQQVDLLDTQLRRALLEPVRIRCGWESLVLPPRAVFSVMESIALRLRTCCTE